MGEEDSFPKTDKQLADYNLKLPFKRMQLAVSFLPCLCKHHDEPCREVALV